MIFTFISIPSIIKSLKQTIFKETPQFNFTIKEFVLE